MVLWRMFHVETDLMTSHLTFRVEGWLWVGLGRLSIYWFESNLQAVFLKIDSDFIRLGSDSFEHMSVIMYNVWLA